MPSDTDADTTPTPRLVEVARQAGVSAITASRALREPEKVAPSTRARVEEAARSLGYVPNLVAGALASARTRQVGMLLPTIASSIFADTANGLTSVLEAEGFATILAQWGYDPPRQERALAALLGRRPEAVVMVGAPLTVAGRLMLERARANGTAVVETWELPTEPIWAAVGFDNRAAGATAAHYLAGTAGRRRLTFFGGSDPRAEARWEGFAAAAKARGAPRPSRIVLPAPASMDAAALAATLPELEAADGVFASNDVLAVGLMSGLRGLGRAVPREVAVLGLGDLDAARHCSPALTTLRIDGGAIGRRAAELVLAWRGGARKNAPAPHEDLGFALVRRESA